MWSDWLKVKVKLLSRVLLFVTPWTVAYQAPPSIEFPGKSCHFLLQGIFPTGDRTQVSCTAGRHFTIWATREAWSDWIVVCNCGYIYYCGQKSLRRNGVAIIVNKRVQNAVLGCNLKNDRMISVHFQGKPFNITVIHVPTSNTWRNWSWMVLWRPIRPSRINIQKGHPFHYRGLECKSRKSRNTWSNRQILPWSTEWSRAKANKVLPRECTGHSKHPLPTT